MCSLQNRRRIGPTFRALLLPAGERPALEQTAVTNWVRRPRPDDGAGRWRSGRAVRRASRSNGRSHHAEAGGWFEVDSRGHRLQFGIVDRHPLHGGIEVPVGRVLGGGRHRHRHDSSLRSRQILREQSRPGRPFLGAARRASPTARRLARGAPTSGTVPTRPSARHRRNVRAPRAKGGATWEDGWVRLILLSSP